MCSCLAHIVPTSITDRSISGALEPKAMRVRLETVSFQILTVAVVVSPFGFFMVISFSWDVMTCRGREEKMEGKEEQKHTKIKLLLYFFQRCQRPAECVLLTEINCILQVQH